MGNRSNLRKSSLMSDDRPPRKRRRLTRQTTFFSLPYELREQIYLETGLVRSCLIDVEKEQFRLKSIRKLYTRDPKDPWLVDDSIVGPADMNERLKERFRVELAKKPCGYAAHHYRSGTLPYYLERPALEHPTAYIVKPRGEVYCTHEALAIGLLGVNKQIRSEVMGILYGRNSFYLTCHNIWPWAWLSPGKGYFPAVSSLPREAWTHIRELHVNLSDEHLTWEWGPGNHNINHPWVPTHDLRILCQLLRTRLRPNRTALRLMCEDNELGHGPGVDAVLALQGLPKLRSLSVALHAEYYTRGGLGADSSPGSVGSQPIDPPPIFALIRHLTAQLVDADADAQRHVNPPFHGRLKCCGTCLDHAKWEYDGCTPSERKFASPTAFASMRNHWTYGDATCACPDYAAFSYSTTCTCRGPSLPLWPIARRLSLAEYIARWNVGRLCDEIEEDVHLIPPHDERHDGALGVRESRKGWWKMKAVPV